MLYIYKFLYAPTGPWGGASPQNRQTTTFRGPGEEGGGRHRLWEKPGPSPLPAVKNTHAIDRPRYLTGMPPQNRGGWRPGKNKTIKKHTRDKGGYVFLLSIYFYRSIHTSTWRWNHIHRYAYQDDVPEKRQGVEGRKQAPRRRSGGETSFCTHYTDIRSRGIRWPKALRIEEGAAAASQNWPVHA